jgi:hypothetical protein
MVQRIAQKPTGVLHKGFPHDGMELIQECPQILFQRMNRRLHTPLQPMNRIAAIGLFQAVDSPGKCDGRMLLQHGVLLDVAVQAP